MKMRICAGVLVVILTFPFAARAQTSAADSGVARLPTTARKAPRPQDLENLAISVLRQRVESVDWNDFTLENVVDWLREQGSMNVVVSWYALEATGVTRDSPVTLSLKETTVGEILKEAIEQVSEDRVVRYRAFRNTIKISTKEDFNQRLALRVYDVTDILFRVPEFYEAPEIDLTQSQQSGGAGASQTGIPVFQDTGGEGRDEEGEEERRERLEELRNMIEFLIEPDFWDTVGGPGSIQPFNRVLAIRASVEVHEEIAGFFAHN